MTSCLPALSASRVLGWSHPPRLAPESQEHLKGKFRSKRPLRYLFLTLLTSLLFTLFSGTIVHAEEEILSDPPVKSASRKSKIAPQLEQRVRQGRSSLPLRVIIRLKEKSKKDRHAGRHGLRPPHLIAQKIQELKNRARPQKREVVDLLKYMKRMRLKGSRKGRTFESLQGRYTGDGIRSYWISNCIVATVTPDELNRLAENPAISEILENIILSVPPVDADGSLSNADPDLWNHKAIGMDEIAYLGLRGAGVRIGHLDTGISSESPDLLGRLAAWAEFGRYGERLETEPHESHYQGHGTHTASIIAGETVGIAPGATLLSALVLPGGSGTLEQVLAGMQWVLDPDDDPETDDGARIVNMSWGMWGMSDILDEAIINMTTAGILPVCAIGNTGPDTTLCPGNTEGAVGVGALEKRDYVPWFTGGGWACWDTFCLLKPDITAPGVQVPGIGPEGEYQTMWGTSAAAPHVAGAAALLLESRPELTLPRLKSFLFNTARDLDEPGPDLRTGRGRLDISRAMDFLDNYAPRFGAADLVLESRQDMEGYTLQRFCTVFSDGESILVEEQMETAPSLDFVPIGMADVSGDGFSDLIVRQTETLGPASYRIVYSVYLSIDAAGLSATPENWYSFVSDVPDPPELIGLSDVDGDGKSDVVYCQWEETYNGKWCHIRALRSTGYVFQDDPSDEEWAKFYARDSYEIKPLLGDVNGDGKSDLILSIRNQLYFYSPISYSVGLSDGSRFAAPFYYWFSLFPEWGMEPLHPLCMSDVNGDGFDDLILRGKGNDLQISTLIYVCLSNGFSRFLTERLWAGIPTGETGRVEGLADVNGDGASDLIAYTDLNGARQFTAWLSNGQNQFLENPHPWFELEDIPLTEEIHFLGAANVGLGNWCGTE